MIGMFNIFLDPAATARRIPERLSWLPPLLLVGIGGALISWFTVPTVMRVMQMNPPGGMTAEQLQRSIGVIETTQRVMGLASPLLAAGFLALLAVILLGACSVLDIKTKFRDLFSLLAHGSLISFVGQLAGFVVLRIKGDEIQTMEELQPSFGLDLIFHEGLSKPLAAALKYFSIFTIWYIVMVALTLAALAACKKGRAFLAMTPVWFLPLIFVVGLSFLRR